MLISSKVEEEVAITMSPSSNGGGVVGVLTPEKVERCFLVLLPVVLDLGRDARGGVTLPPLLFKLAFEIEEFNLSGELFNDLDSRLPNDGLALLCDDRERLNAVAEGGGVTPLEVL